MPASHAYGAGIHVFLCLKTWMAGTSPAMTVTFSRARVLLIKTDAFAPSSPPLILRPLRARGTGRPTAGRPMHRQSLIEYGKPLQATDAPTPAPTGHARCWCASRIAACATPTCTCRTAISISAAARSSTCAATGRCPSRSAMRSPASVEAAGPDAPGAVTGQAVRGLSLDRLRQVRAVRAGRRAPVQRAARARHHRRRRLRNARAGAASALPARRGGHRAGDRRRR